MLKERFRWSAFWEGARLFVVFQGAIVTDSAKGNPSRPGQTTRFYLVAVDSMRTWQNEDCNGMRIPNR